jgi:hypothetical protein
MSDDKAEVGAIRARCEGLEARNEELVKRHDALDAKQKKLGERVTVIAAIGAVAALAGAYVSCRRLPAETEKLRAEVSSLRAQEEKNRADSQKSLAESAAQREPNFELSPPEIAVGASNATVSLRVLNLKPVGLTVLFYGVRVWEPTTTIDEIERAPAYEKVNDAEIRVRRDAVSEWDNELVTFEDGHTIGAERTGSLSIRLQAIPPEGALVEVFVYVAEHRDGVCVITALPNQRGKRPQLKPPVPGGKACFYDVRYARLENGALTPA